MEIALLQATEPPRWMLARGTLIRAARLVAGSLALAIWAGCAANTRPRSPAPEGVVRPITPEPSDLVGAWFGIGPDDLYYYLLSLDEGGRGYLVYAFVDDPPFVLPVTNWGLQGRAITVGVDATKSVLKPLVIRGTAGLSILRLTITGAGWEHSLLFRKRSAFERKYHRLISAPENQ